MRGACIFIFIVGTRHEATRGEQVSYRGKGGREGGEFGEHGKDEGPSWVGMRFD